MQISFTIPGRIRGQGRPRFAVVAGHGRAYTDAKTRSDAAMIKHFAAQAMTGRPPLEGPLLLSVAVFIQPPPSWSKKKRNSAYYVTGKPDCSNALKQLEDAANGILWLDDSQIADIQYSRRYSLAEVEHIKVTVMQLGVAQVEVAA